MTGRLRATCVTCEQPYYPLRRGLCEPCYRAERRARLGAVRGRRPQLTLGSSSKLGSPDLWHAEAKRWLSEGYPNIAQSYRDLAEIAANRSEPIEASA